jgi:hypothetical protein
VSKPNQRYISLSTAISDWIEDYQFDEPIEEEILTKWITDILRQMQVENLLNNKITILDVDGYKAVLPEDLRMVCEVAYRLEPPKCGPKERLDKVTQWVQGTDEGCELEINVNCPDCHKTGCKEVGQNYVEVNVDKLWELQNPHMFSQYSSKFATVSRFGYGKSTYTPDFKLLKYGGGNPWNNSKLHLSDCANVHCHDCEHTYDFNTNNIEVSFKKGEVLISYMAVALDEKGDMLILDDSDVLEAVSDYVLYKYMRKMYFKEVKSRGNKDSNFYRAYKDSEQSHYRSLARARSKLTIPSYLDWIDFLKSNKYHKIDNAYSNILDGKSYQSRSGKHYGRTTAGLTNRNVYKDKRN